MITKSNMWGGVRAKSGLPEEGLVSRRGHREHRAGRVKRPSPQVSKGGIKKGRERTQTKSKNKKRDYVVERGKKKRARGGDHAVQPTES